MVITVSCPACSSSFPVDPAKVPKGGVNVRCSICADVFRVDEPAHEPGFDASPLGPARGATDFAVPDLPPPAPVEDVDVELAGSAEDWMIQTEEAIEAELPTLAEPDEPLPPPEVPAPAVDHEEPAAEGFRFGKRDPADKARRLARVLVSDMIMYNAERHQNALASGTLAEDFEEEIDKSWKEYVDQVGQEIAEGDGRRFWTEALNDILAKGQPVF
jgi:predicted Zn finger-like uncharacterized protein